MERENQKTNRLQPGTCYSGCCARCVLVGPEGTHAHIEAFTPKTTTDAIATLSPWLLDITAFASCYSKGLSVTENAAKVM